MKEKISKWYKFGLWTESMVQDAVVRGVITLNDLKEIIGEMEE